MNIPSRHSFQQTFIQTAWDSTSLGAWMKCPTKYFYSIVLGYRTSDANLNFKFGSIVHHGLETYHKSRAKGLDHDDAQYRTLGHMLINYGDWLTDSTQKNLWTAIRSIIWHTEQFEETSSDEVVDFSGTPAIELPFKYDLGIKFEDTSILYCGHIDKIIRQPTGGVWVVDYKTTKNQIDQRYFMQYSPSTQLPGYAIAAKVCFEMEVQGVQVDAIQVGVNFSRFGKGHIILTKAQEDEWLRDARWQISNAMNVMKNAAGDPALVPRNTESCFGCEFRAVCAHPPSLRPNILAGGYEQKFWDPLARKEAL